MSIKRRTRRQNKFGDYYRTCGLPKGESTADRKAREHRQEVAIIKAVRASVFRRDGSCRSCHGTRRVMKSDEMHEIRSRAQTRGLPPEQRFNNANCVRLCHLCHQDVTERRLKVTPVSDVGANGSLIFQGAVILDAEVVVVNADRFVAAIRPAAATSKRISPVPVRAIYLRKEEDD